jgi:hypothetical protein
VFPSGAFLLVEFRKAVAPSEESRSVEYLTAAFPVADPTEARSA